MSVQLIKSLPNPSRAPKSIENLPEEVLLEIFRFVKDPSHSSVCKLWNRIYDDDALYKDLSIFVHSTLVPGMYKQLARDHYNTLRETLRCKECSTREKAFAARKQLSPIRKIIEKNSLLIHKRNQAVIARDFGLQQALESEMNAQSSMMLIGAPFIFLAEIFVTPATPFLMAYKQKQENKKLSALSDVERAFGKLSNEVFDHLQARYELLHTMD
ncbi:MAG: F-box protein [Simkaniaceae bacterium]|nr:F-box protein [Simkaniaceae bacterium]